MDADEQNILLEQSILGIIIADNSNLHKVPHIQAKFFLNSVHRKIFEYIWDRFERGKNTDLLIISAFLNKEDIPLTYLEKLQENFKDGNLVSYLEMLYNVYLRHEGLKMANKIIYDSADYTIDFSSYLLNVENNLINVLANHRSQEATDIHQSMKLTMELYHNKNQRFKTNNRFIDETTGGFGVGELTIIAARPSVGKTALTVSIARSMAENQVPVMLLSLEMPQEQICMRILSNMNQIPLNYFIHQKLTQDMLIDCSRSIDALQNMPFYINDNPSCHIKYLSNLLRVNIKKYKIKVVFIDYLQLILNDSQMSHEQAIANISRTLKILSKELNIAVVCLSQMSRKIESRSGDNKQPQLSDLRYSGAIEQDADIVLFLYRKNQENKKEVTITIEKNRNGPLGEQEFEFDGSIMSFTEQNNQNIVQYI